MVSAIMIFVVDGTDNFPTLLFRTTSGVLTKKPNVYGSSSGSMVSPVLLRIWAVPCYRGHVPGEPCLSSSRHGASCAEGGVLGVLPGIHWSASGHLSGKAILGIGDTLIGRLVSFDALRWRFREFKVRPDPSGPIWRQNPTIH